MRELTKEQIEHVAGAGVSAYGNWDPHHKKDPHKHPHKHSKKHSKKHSHKHRPRPVY